ncbi:hypothetical protein ACFL5K_01360 [Gemmatimonadota bacterium]
MEIAAKNIYDVLQSKGINKLYHANSVITACQFLRYKALLSRGAVEKLQCYQTPQKTDSLDKRYGIWHDIFLDTADYHNKISRRNLYGPVLFKINIESITVNYTGPLWMTKLNPTKWSGKKLSERWFNSKEDLETNFVSGEFDHMLVIRHTGGEFPLGNSLNEIIIDDPNLESESKVKLYDMAYGAIQYAISESGSKVPIKKRECKNSCECLEQYRSDRNKTEQLYWPGKI